MNTRFNSETQICGSVAHRASSLGAMMYNAAYEKLGLNFVYLPFSSTDTEGVVRGMKALGLRGLAVADPHNVKIGRFLDSIDPVADRIGSVNTVLNEKGSLKGFNSDWIGFKTAFEEVTTLKGRKAIVLGNGGAARSVVYALVFGGAEEVLILSRNQSHGENLARLYGLNYGPLTALPEVQGYDTLINATSVGSVSNPTPEIVDRETVASFEVIADVVFSPVETPLINRAKQLGKATISGWRMLLHQGMFQFKLFTEVEPPVEFIADILYRGLASK